MDTSHTPSGTQTYSKRRMPGPAREAFADHAVNCWLWDTQGNCWLDFVAGLGPVILGHRYPEVENAVRRQLGKGNCFSLPTLLEEQIAERLARLIPCTEQTRFLKNGADALEAAVRVARAVTGRDLVLRCGYHGMHDWCIESRGIPADVRQLTVPLPYHTLPNTTHPYAALVIEPVVASTGIFPQDGYLESLRAWCDKQGTLLVFDEAVTGFRMHLGGAQTYFGVTPDLACFSKAMANGYPISALCGKRKHMHTLEQGVFVSTTFGGDPVGLAAAAATIDVLESEDVLTKIGAFGARLKAAYEDTARTLGLDTWLVGYPQRWLARWANPTQESAFNEAVATAHVLAPGYYNCMYAHCLQQEEVLGHLADAWTLGFQAARSI